MIEIEKVRDLNNDEVVVVIEASEDGKFACTVERYSEEYFKKHILIELAILQKFNKRLELGDMYPDLYDMIRDDFDFTVNIPTTEWGVYSNLESIAIIINNSLYEVRCDMSLEELVEGRFLSRQQLTIKESKNDKNENDEYERRKYGIHRKSKMYKRK